MKVCIEYVILDNLVMDYLLLKETAVILKIGFTKARILFASVIGVLGAVILPVLEIRSEYLFLLKILLGLLISFIAVNHFSFKAYLKYFNFFLLFTFLIGGVTLGAFYLMNVNVYDYCDNPSILPVGLTVGVAYLVALTVKGIVKKSVNGIITDKYRYKCIIKAGETAVRVNGYFDSGNMLIDRKTGLPVALCKKSVIKKIIRKGGKLSVPRKMEISTVSSYGNINLYEIDCMLIEKENENKRAACLLGEVNNSSMKEEMLLSVYVM